MIDPINGSAHPTTFAYDAMNRLTGITYPDNTSVSFGYDTGSRTAALAHRLDGSETRPHTDPSLH